MGKKVTRENSDEFVGLPKRSPKKWPERVKRKGNIKVTKKVTRKSPKNGDERSELQKFITGKVTKKR